jgi:hypothetical protein
MRRLAIITALALALTGLPFASTAANAATPPAGWVYWGTLPQQWICVYVGNQLVVQRTAQVYGCGITGPQYDLWYLPYPS